MNLTDGSVCVAGHGGTNCLGPQEILGSAAGSEETFVHSIAPEAPVHGGEQDCGTKGHVDDHVGLPLVTHVTSSHDVDVGEDVPRYEQGVGVSERHKLWLSGLIDIKTVQSSGLDVVVKLCH